MYAHLWTGDAAPPEYVDFILKRDVYHCTPEELKRQKVNDVLVDLTCLEIETKVQKIRNRPKHKRRASMS